MVERSILFSLWINQSQTQQDRAHQTKEVGKRKKEKDSERAKTTIDTIESKNYSEKKETLRIPIATCLET